MAQIYTNVTVSLTNQSNPPAVEMMQGDNGRGLDIFVTNDIVTNGQGVVDSTLKAVLYAEKPSGLKVSLNSSRVIRYENTDTYEIRFDGSDKFANMIAEVGIVKAQVCLMSGNSYVTTFDILIKVVENIAMQIDIESTEEFSNVAELIKTANATLAELNKYVEMFKEQTKLTVNVRSGTQDPVATAEDKAGDIYIKYEG
jgi:hypothetical protein